MAYNFPNIGNNGLFFGSGAPIRKSVRAATIIAGNLATDFANGQTIDSVVLATGDRILIKNQVSQVDNGIYVVQASGAPLRDEDFTVGSSIRDVVFFVEEGNTNTRVGYASKNTKGNDVVGTNNLIFTRTTNPLSFASQTVYVSKAGDDGLGTGTFNNPFQTIQMAMSSITDSSQSKVYAVHVGAGLYNDSFAFKPWVSLIGAPNTSAFQGTTTIGAPAVVSFDASWAGATYDVAWFAHFTFNGAITFTITNVNAQISVFDCLFNSGVSFTGNHAGNVNNITLDDCLSYGAVSVQDCQYLFLLGGTEFYNTSCTITSTSAVFPSTTTLLALGGSLSTTVSFVSGGGSGGAIGDMRGCSVNGTLNLNGAATRYTSTVEGIPQTVALTNGAPTYAFYTYAPSLGYTPTTPANWVGPAPTQVQNALDRIAAVLNTHFGAIP